MQTNHHSIEFQPALRFSPRSSGVHLYLEDNADGTPLWFKDIYFCEDSGRCVDEARNDASLQTRPDPSNGLLARRIRHFSGYNVGVGLTDSGSLY